MANSEEIEINTQLKMILQRLRYEYNVSKLKGFPSRQVNRYSQRSYEPDVKIPALRWREWANEIGVDYNRFLDILEILKRRGILAKYEFIDTNSSR